MLASTALLGLAQLALQEVVERGAQYDYRTKLGDNRKRGRHGGLENVGAGFELESQRQRLT